MLKKFWIQALRDKTFQNSEKPLFLYVKIEVYLCMRLAFLLLFVLVISVAQGQNFNRPVPTGFPQYEFEIFDSSYTGHYTTQARLAGSPSDYRYIAVLDADGYYSGSGINF